VEAEMRGETPLKYKGSEFMRAIERLREKITAENA